MRVYTVSFEEQAETVAVDMWELTPADDKPIAIVGLFIGQHTELSDAQEEQMPYSIIRGHATSGSGGDTTTPVPVNKNAGTVGFTAETNNTTAASTGTPLTIHSDTFNIRTGEKLWWPSSPLTWPTADQGDTTLVVRLGEAPADSITWTGTLYVVELA